MDDIITAAIAGLHLSVPLPNEEFKEILSAVGKLNQHLINDKGQTKLVNLTETVLQYILSRLNEGINNQAEDIVEDWYEAYRAFAGYGAKLPFKHLEINNMMTQFLEKLDELVPQCLDPDNYESKVVVLNAINHIIAEVGSNDAYIWNVLQFYGQQIKEFCSNVPESKGDPKSLHFFNSVHIIHKILVGRTCTSRFEDKKMYADVAEELKNLCDSSKLQDVVAIYGIREVLDLLV